MRRSILLPALLVGVATSVFLAGVRPSAWAHCQVPCGIYDDHARIHAMLEDATTISKAVDSIGALAGAHDPESVNQATRWIATKEQHATRIQTTIAEYFLTQRIKPAAPGTPEWDDYVSRLAAHHAVLVAAMKTKQTIDRDQVQVLRDAIDGISVYYPG